MSDRGRTERPANMRAAPFVTFVLAGRALLRPATLARAVISTTPKLDVEGVEDLRIHRRDLHFTESTDDERAHVTPIQLQRPWSTVELVQVSL